MEMAEILLHEDYGSFEWPNAFLLYAKEHANRDTKPLISYWIENPWPSRDMRDRADLEVIRLWKNWTEETDFVSPIQICKVPKELLDLDLILVIEYDGWEDVMVSPKKLLDTINKRAWDLVEAIGTGWTAEQGIEELATWIQRLKVLERNL